MFKHIYSHAEKNAHNYLLLALSFFCTVSVYVTDLIVVFLAILWLISGGFKKKLKIIFSHPVIAGSVYFFIYFLCSYLWFSGPVWSPIIKKQLLILLLPILYTLNFDQQYIEKAKYAFIFGLSLNILLSIITLYIPSNPFFKTGHYESNLFLHGFLDHFDYSIFLCFGIFILFSFLEKKKFFRYFILIVIFLIALLNSYGRIGIISFFLFFPLIIIISKQKNIKYSILSIPIIFGLMSYYIFPPLHNRVNQTINSIKLLSSEMSLSEKIENDAIYLSSKNDSLSTEYYRKEIMKNEKWVESIKNKEPKYETSIGQRYLYVKNSLNLINKKPFIGFGASQFEKVYMKYYPDLKSIKHPHNNFLFVLVELGICGLVILLYIFYSQLRLFLINKDRSMLQLILPLYFLWIMLFDNYFLNHNTLVFFCLFSFLIYYRKRVKYN